MKERVVGPEAGKKGVDGLDHWASLARYLEDGRFEIDNNLAENAVRPLKLEAKNWLFFGSQHAGHNAAVIYTLVENCRRHGIPVEGYLCELYAIPEIRKFYQHFHNVWPYWFYFCDLHTETLQMMTLCLLPNLQGFKRLGEPKAAVEYDPLDLITFISKNFIPLNLMMGLKSTARTPAEMTIIIPEPRS